jgi:hypothetical protein
MLLTIGEETISSCHRRNKLCAADSTWGRTTTKQRKPFEKDFQEWLEPEGAVNGLKFEPSLNQKVKLIKTPCLNFG